MRVSDNAGRCGNGPFRPPCCAPFSVWLNYLVLFATFLPVTHAATIEIGSVTATSGGQIDVPMVADVGTEALGSYNVFVSYDTNLLQFVGFTNGDTNFGRASVNATLPGEIRACANNIQSLSLPTGVVEVARMTFRATGRAGTSASVSFNRAELLRGDDVRDLPATASDGSISISASVGESAAKTFHLAREQASRPKVEWANP